ncbi:MAG: NAD(P)/FAD-dependent oxidoreductase [Deltaproteobacteria bacterium]|nr:MAG: NAD(P)/FAD-dependent oxidoreductase [Deltaproteobacteria bacterium]
MTTTDVIVIGAGPAGSAAATVLAERGIDVCVVERERFPRFHIGESLLPATLSALDRIGVRLDPDEHQYKAGARFLDESTGQEQTYWFHDTLPGTPDHAYQVERALFDGILADRAIRAGARVTFGAKVTDVHVDDDGVSVRTDAGDVRGRYLLDATGQNALLARRRRTLRRIHGFGRAAAFLHFSEIPDAALDEIEPHGNIQILRTPFGWIWAIPLRGRRLSVGVVAAEGRISEQDVRDAVATSDLLRRWTRGATATEPTLVGDYSYVNTEPHGARFGCIGDAACFLDPVFSSGVTLALLGATSAAEAVGAALARGDEADPDLLADHAARMKLGYRAFYLLIHRFYHTAIFENLFFSEDPDPLMRRGLVTMLAGDVWREDNVFQNLLFASRRVDPSREIP